MRGYAQGELPVHWLLRLMGAHTLHTVPACSLDTRGTGFPGMLQDAPANLRCHMAGATTNSKRWGIAQAPLHPLLHTVPPTTPPHPQRHPFKTSHCI